jgi:hypothetical protein
LTPLGSGAYVLKVSHEGKEAAAGRRVSSRARVAVFLFFILGVVLTACRSHPVHQPANTIYGGRFRFDIPTEFTLRGEGGFVKGVELIGVTLPAGPSLPAARAAFWKDHLAKVRRNSRSHDLPPIQEEGELRPGIPKLVYLGYAEVDLVHEALLTEPGRGVIVKAAWRESYKPEDRPAQKAERLHAFNEVVNAFSFLPPGYIAADPEAYYIKEGMVRITYPPSTMQNPEHYEIGFDGKTQRMKFNFDYDYPDEPSDNRPRLLERAAKTMAELAISARSLRSGHRVVGGFSGQESVLHIKDEKTLGLTWMYEPVAAEGFQPTITVKGESDDNDVPAVLALWDQILDSVQRLVQ